MDEPYFIAVRKPNHLKELEEKLKTLYYDEHVAGFDAKSNSLFRLKAKHKKVGVVVAMAPGYIYQIESLIKENQNGAEVTLH